jgi:hypothetical protein
MEKLTREHAEWLSRRVGPMMRFFDDLRGRLEKRGYHKGHSLYREVSACYNALHSLSVTAHYGSCMGGLYGASADSFGPGDDAKPSQDPSPPQSGSG